jgi:hypothetical protein
VYLVFTSTATASSNKQQKFKTQVYDEIYLLGLKEDARDLYCGISILIVKFSYVNRLLANMV